jgi:hypothetical protein
LPARLWQQHGDKVQKFVILQPVVDRKMWTVELRIYFPKKLPQVVFRGGWRLFVVGNGLGIGDRLKFTLTERSKFEVAILRCGGDPKVPSVLRPKVMPMDSKCSRRRAKNCVAPQYMDVMRDKGVTSERELNGPFAKEAGTAEDRIVHSTSNIAYEASSKSPSDMDCHFFEALEIAGSDMDSHFFESLGFPPDLDSHFLESSELPSDMDSHFFESVSASPSI